MSVGSSGRVSFDDLLGSLHAGLTHPPDMVLATGCGTAHWMPQLAAELGAAYGLGPTMHSDNTNLLFHVPLFVRGAGRAGSACWVGEAGTEVCVCSGYVLLRVCLPPPIFQALTVLLYSCVPWCDDFPPFSAPWDA